MLLVVGSKAAEKGEGNWGIFPLVRGPIATLSIKDQDTLIEQSP